VHIQEFNTSHLQKHLIGGVEMMEDRNCVLVTWLGVAYRQCQQAVACQYLKTGRCKYDKNENL
jgi:hypothetical protein